MSLSWATWMHQCKGSPKSAKQSMQTLSPTPTHARTQQPLQNKRHRAGLQTVCTRNIKTHIIAQYAYTDICSIFLWAYTRCFSHLVMKPLSEGSSPILESDPATSDSVTAAMVVAGLLFEIRHDAKSRVCLELMCSFVPFGNQSTPDVAKIISFLVAQSL